MDILQSYASDTELKMAERISEKVLALVNQNLAHIMTGVQEKAAGLV